MKPLELVVERLVRINYCVLKRDSFFDIYRMGIESNALYSHIEGLHEWN